MKMPKPGECCHGAASFRQTDAPRPGDGELKCLNCGHVERLLRNPETLRRSRRDSLERAQKTGWIVETKCAHCPYHGPMAVEMGPWPIATCPECGKRYDFYKWKPPAEP